METEQYKRPGFRVKDYFVSFPEEGDFITENEDGSMSLAVDIFKIDVNNNLTATDMSSLSKEESDDLQVQIEAWVNTALENAIEMYEKENKK